MRRISTHLALLSQKIQSETISWGEVHEELGQEAPLLALVFLSVPFLQPIPLPALSTALGLLMIFLGVCVSLNKNFALPRSFKKLVLPQIFFSLMLKTLSFILSKAERLIHPRGIVFIEHPAIQFLSGIMIIISSFFLMLPLPPGFNFPPALICCIVSLAILEKDCVLLCIGTLFFILEAGLLYLAITWIKQLIYIYF